MHLECPNPRQLGTQRQCFSQVYALLYLIKFGLVNANKEWHLRSWDLWSWNDRRRIEVSYYASDSYQHHTSRNGCFDHGCSIHTTTSSLSHSFPYTMEYKGWWKNIWPCCILDHHYFPTGILRPLTGAPILSSSRRARCEGELFQIDRSKKA